MKAPIEPLPIFLLRLAMLVAFAACLSIMAPKLCFILAHPGAIWPPGTHDYRMSVVSGVRFYRVRDASGRVICTGDFNGKVRESGPVIGGE